MKTPSAAAAPRLAALAVALAACAAPAPEPPEPTRGYLLVSLDTLAADHLGCYGYERDTSPFLDEFAARGALFEQALVQYPSTLVSHVSMFTGLYPQEHGVYPPSKVLSPRIEMLPERFNGFGFRTAGHTEGGFVSRHFGFARGFEEFDDTVIQADTDVEKTLARGLDFLSRLGPDERFFLFLHTYSIHDPYEPPAPYDGMFWEGEPPADRDSSQQRLNDVNAGHAAIGTETLEYFRAQYDASIRYVDDRLREFFAGVERLGLADELTVVVTSDHGEEFGQHGRLGHSQVYPESLRVPLVVVHPRGLGGRRIARPVALVDLPPTLYELAGLPAAEGISGRSLVPDLAGAGPGAPPPVYAEVLDGPIQRTLVVETDGGTRQVLETALPAERDGTWVTRSTEFDAPGGELVLELAPFAGPRTVEVAADGRPLDRIELAGGWTTARLELPRGAGPVRVGLATAGCASPLRTGAGDDPRCLSFKVRGAPLVRTELYDLDADPGGRTDLSSRQPELRRRLAERLAELSFLPAHAPESRELAPESEAALRALGYLD